MHDHDTEGKFSACVSNYYQIKREVSGHYFVIININRREIVLTFFFLDYQILS